MISISMVHITTSMLIFLFNVILYENQSKYLNTAFHNCYFVASDMMSANVNTSSFVVSVFFVVIFQIVLSRVITVD